MSQSIRNGNNLKSELVGNTAFQFIFKHTENFGEQNTLRKLENALVFDLLLHITALK
jgi:hypothetical protein